MRTETVFSHENTSGENRVVKRFDKYEKRGAYHWGVYENNTWGYRELVDFCIDYLPHQGSVLDVGCGDGLTSYKMFEKGLDVLGIDNNELSISLAREMSTRTIYGANPVIRLVRRGLKVLSVCQNELVRRAESGLRFRVQSIYDLDKRETFDFVLCHDVIEHVEFPEELLDRVWHSMRYFAIISTPDGTYEKPRGYDYQLWTPEEFSYLLRNYRFEFLPLDHNRFISLKNSKMVVKLFK